MINIKQKDGRTEETVYVLDADAITCQKPLIYLGDGVMTNLLSHALLSS